MQVSIENTGAIGRRMTVSLSPDAFEKAFTARLKRMSKQVKLPGFRPGKVPLKVVEAQYGSQLIQEVTGELIQTSFQEAIGKEGLRPAGGPKIDPKNLERGKDLEYVAEFDIYPEVNKQDLSGETLEIPTCEIQDADIEETLKTMQKQRMLWQPVEREAKNDDQVTIDFDGKIDGKAFDGGQASAVPLVLGSGAMIPGFEEGLLKVKAGEQKDVSLTFPEDYQAPHLAGKKAVFSVKVQQVAEGQLPELSEDFAKQFGVESGSLDELRQGIKDNLNREATARIRNITRDRVLEALLAANDFELPQGMIAEEVQQIRTGRARQRQEQGMPAVADEDESELNDAARRRVTLGLIIGEIINQKNLKPGSSKVRLRVEELASGYENPPALVAWYYEKPERLREIESVVLEEAVVDAVLATATVKNSTIAFKELVAVKAIKS